MSVEIREEWDRPLVCTVAGTHSAGKTTLVQSFEQGKVQDLLREDLLYDDFGYGLVSLPMTDRSAPVICVPESARWGGDYSEDPTLLGENWNLEFQLQVSEKYMLRAQTALELAGAVTRQLIATNPDLTSAELTRPLIITDRSVLEGLAYTRLRSDLASPDVIGGFPREKFFKQWVAHYVDVVFLADHSEILFVPDQAQSDDPELRQAIAEEITADYHSVLPAERIRTLHGNPEERRHDLLRFVTEHI